MSGGSKSQTIGYKYFSAIHMVLCHGPIDYIKKILVDEDITLIEGNYKAGSHTIKKENLFGGEKKQGGISGVLHFMDGNANQQVNPVVEQLQGPITGPSTVPAYRGVASIFLSGIKSKFRNKDGMYLGMNPYLKTWKTLCQRIYSTSDGTDQWYKEKAAIPSIFTPSERVMFQIAIDTSGSMAGERLNLVKIQLKNLLDFFALYAEDSQLDVSIVAWGAYSGQFINLYDIDDAKMQTLVNFIDGLSAGGGTDFRAAFIRSEDFFQPQAIKKDSEKYMFFITDGEPDDAGNAGAARSENSSMINGTGIWSASPVSIIGFNIELTDISQTQKVVNNGVYVIQSADSSGMIDAAQDAFKLAYWDMNPIHIIRECLVNESWGNETPVYEIDDVSFKKAADLIYSEAFGMSIKWTQEGSISEFIGEILRHINAVLYEEPRTGMQTIKLIRDDYLVDDLSILDESKITQVSDFQKSSFGELINQVTVTYTEIQNGENGTVTVQDTALVAAQGGTNSKSVKYQGFSNIRNAGRAGMRDLKSYATPLISADITVTRSAGIDYRQGDVFKWNWSKYGVSGVVMRIVAIGLGDAKDNKIVLTCIEDIFAMPQNTVTTVKPVVPQQNNLEDISSAIAFEVPYFGLVQRIGEAETNQLLNTSPEAGFYGVAAEKPSGGASTNAELYLTSLVSGNFILDSTVNFSPTFKLPFPLGRLDTTLIVPVGSVKDFGLIDLDEDLPLISQIGDELISISGIELRDDEESFLISFYRGVFDTVPDTHEEGETCYIWDILAGGSETQYIDGETVIGKLTNNSFSAATDVEDAEELPLTFVSRASRPYPPANVKISGQYSPEMVSGRIDVSLRHRNKVLQDTVPVGWYDDSSTLIPEGLQYQIEVYIDNNLIDDQIFDASENINFVSEKLFSGDATLKIYSLLGGYKSLHHVEKHFYYTFGVATPINLMAEVY